MAAKHEKTKRRANCGGFSRATCAVGRPWRRRLRAPYRVAARDLVKSRVPHAPHPPPRAPVRRLMVMEAVNLPRWAAVSSEIFSLLRNNRYHYIDHRFICRRSSTAGEYQARFVYILWSISDVNAAMWAGKGVVEEVKAEGMFNVSRWHIAWCSPRQKRALSGTRSLLFSSKRLLAASSYQYTGRTNGLPEHVRGRADISATWARINIVLDMTHLRHTRCRAWCQNVLPPPRMSASILRAISPNAQNMRYRRRHRRARSAWHNGFAPSCLGRRALTAHLFTIICAFRAAPAALTLPFSLSRSLILPLHTLPFTPLRSALRAPGGGVNGVSCRLT